MSMRAAEDRDSFLKTVAVSRLCILTAIAEYRVTPWFERVPQVNWPVVEKGWYRSYEDLSMWNS
jgi:hypothetical protein